MAVTLKPVIITPRVTEILRTVHFYRYMTALDITHALFSGGSLTHVRDILKLLCGGADNVENQYLFRFPLPQFSAGKTEKIFTLGSKGRDYLAQELGMPVDWYFRPSHIRHLTYGLMNHNLTLTRFLICSYIFTRKSDFTIKDMRICYEMEKTGSKVIPDAWILFVRRGAEKDARSPVLLEIDAGSAYRERFLEHIKSRIEFLRSGGYQKMFNSKGCLIAYVTTGELPQYRQTRKTTMCQWAMDALNEMGLGGWAPILRFAAIERKEMYKMTLFNAREWRRPDSDLPLALLHD